MENQDVSKKGGMFNQALTYGLLTGIGLIILGLITYMFNLYTVTWLQYIGYLVLLAGIIFGTIKFRDEHSGGYISYSQALGFGTLLSLVAGIVSGVFTYIFFSFLAPDALETLRNIAEQQMLERAPNATDEQLNFARRFVHPLVFLFSGIFGNTFVGFIFSLITSAFLKKKEPLPEM